VGILASLLERLLGPAAPSITVEEAYTRHIDAETPTLLVDVRQPVEHRTGTITGAMLVPLTEIGRHVAELPRDRQIMTICQSGHRSPLAARRLRKAGFDVLNVDGGMQTWQAAGLPVRRAEGQTDAIPDREP
jgi:rhodanese-related sulfurtransferase